MSREGSREKCRAQQKSIKKEKRKKDVKRMKIATKDEQGIVK